LEKDESSINDNVLLVGGGCGGTIAFSFKILVQKGNQTNNTYRRKKSSDIIETNEYQKFGKLLITTDDGSCGKKVC